VKVLVTGGRGQLGRALVRRAGTHEVFARDLPELDICDATAVDRTFAEVKPEVVINAAAYTAVDRAEAEPEKAFAVNRDAVAILAGACSAHHARLLHVSTDYVFSGSAQRPYREDEALQPSGVYGASKAAGEQAVGSAGTVVRTSWLFGEGGPSFVHTMIRLAKERPVLRVVADQRGCPTCADDLAIALFELAARPELESIYHFCNAGPTTWHAFAEAVIAAARQWQPLVCERVDPITTAEYPTPAKRPAYSVLDTSRIARLGIVPRSWEQGLNEMLMKELGR